MHVIKKTVAVVTLSLVASSSYAACIIQSVQPTTFLTKGFTVHTATIQASLASMDVAVKAAMEFQTGNIIAAVDVMTAQKALTGKQLSTAVKNNSQVQAQAMQEVNRTKRVKDALKVYGVQGAGYKACEVHDKRVDINVATESVDVAVPEMVKSEVTARPGKYTSRKDAMATRLALHNKYYCTADQAATGLCGAEGERAGKSLAAQTLFEPSSYQSQAYRDKSALINNMVGLPDDPVPKALANSVQGQAYSDLKRRKDAIKSTAIASLKSIQAQWSTVPSIEPEDKGNTNLSASTVGNTEKQQLANAAPADDPNAPKPLAVQIKADVDRYLGGGEEYKEWSKTLAGLEEKGVLTELVKNKALRLYMQAEKYKQYSRMEAMLASNVAAMTVNTGLEGNVEQQRQIAVRSNIKDKILAKQAQQQ